MRSNSKFLAIAALILSAIAIAPTRSFALGDAGCGLGSMIFTKNAKLSQSLAMTTNVSTYTQLFGITSGTSNCSSKGLAQNDQEALFYAEANFQNLKVEMARGQGESLAAFAQLMGCTDQVTTHFEKVARDQFEKLYPSRQTTPREMFDGLKGTIQQDPSLAQACANNA